MILNKSCKFILLGALVVPFSAALISGAIDNTSKINAQPSFSPTYHKFELHDLTKTLNKDISTHVCLDLSYPALGVNNQSSWLCDIVGSNFLKVNGSYVPQGSPIGVDASQGDSHFRFYLYENTIHYTANRYTVLTFSGTQQTYSGANFLVSPSQFIFDNVTKQFEVFEPEIEITTGEGIQLVDGIYYIEPGTNLSSFMASVTNNLDNKFGDVSISYTCENLINNKFVKNEKDVLTSSKITVKVDCNYEIFEFNYDLKIGYRDFEMLEGAAISYEGNLGDMLVGAEISNTVLNKFNDPTFGALFVKTQDLIDNNLELTPESVFLNNISFSINKSPSPSQVYLHQTEDIDIIPSSNVSYAYVTIDNFPQRTFHDQWTALIYVKSGDEYIFSRYYQDDILNNSRSLVDVVNDCIDNGDPQSEILTKKYLNPLTGTLLYKIRLIEEGTNSLVASYELSGQINSNITVNLNSVIVNGYEAAFNRPTTITHKLSHDRINFDFFVRKKIGSKIDRIAYSVPFIDTSDFDNEYNADVCKNLTDAGYNAVLFDEPITRVGSQYNVDAIKNIINMFYKHGLKTYISLHSIGASDNFSWNQFPDFTMCPGFAGFNDWDEPMMKSKFDGSIDAGVKSSLISHAKMFNDVYVNKDVCFGATLYPSYGFSNNNLNIWSGYLDDYTHYVLHDNITSPFEKVISTDFYPYNISGSTTSLKAGFTGSLLAMRSESNNYLDSPVVILQSGVTIENDVAINENQMKQEAYAALAYGMDGISWYSYSNNDAINVCSPVDKNNNIIEPYYSYHKSVNNEIKNVSSILENCSYIGVCQMMYTSSDSIYVMSNMEYAKTALLNDLPGNITIDTVDNMSRYPFFVGVYKNNITSKYSYILATFVNDRDIKVSIDVHDMDYNYSIDGITYNKLQTGIFDISFGKGVVITEL